MLYRNDGDANFTDISYKAGIAQITIPFLGWGDGFLDYDNDGWKDLMFINGHVYPEVDKNDWGTSFAERPLLFRNLKGQKFENVPPVKGTGLADVIPGRGGGVRRPLQRRQDRCGDQVMDGSPDAAAQCERRPSPLGRDEADRRPEESRAMRSAQRCISPQMA